ncbi:MAG: hypothetical protein WDZ94_03130 [Patescibacteria group bacterium]
MRYFFILVMVSFLLFSLTALRDMGASFVVTKKCAFETNKPYESRDELKIQEEARIFDSCMESTTFFEKITFGWFI